eukprot:6253273-Pyramimonas_sp.AAC.1
MGGNLNLRGIFKESSRNFRNLSLGLIHAPKLISSHTRMLIRSCDAARVPTDLGSTRPLCPYCAGLPLENSSPPIIIFPERTNQTRAAWVYSHNGPIRRGFYDSQAGPRAQGEH